MHVDIRRMKSFESGVDSPPPNFNCGQVDLELLWQLSTWVVGSWAITRKMHIRAAFSLFLKSEIFNTFIALLENWQNIHELCKIICCYRILNSFDFVKNRWFKTNWAPWEDCKTSNDTWMSESMTTWKQANIMILFVVWSRTYQAWYNSKDIIFL